MNRQHSKVRRPWFGVTSSYIRPLTCVIHEELEPENTSRYEGGGYFLYVFNEETKVQTEKVYRPAESEASMEGSKRGWLLLTKVSALSFALQCSPNNSDFGETNYSHDVLILCVSLYHAIFTKLDFLSL
jgi:hypothetical protein